MNDYIYINKKKISVDIDEVCNGTNCLKEGLDFLLSMYHCFLSTNHLNHTLFLNTGIRIRHISVYNLMDIFIRT